MATKATEVQTVLFDKEKFTLQEAKSWLSDHDMKNSDVDETENKYRFRQFPPSECQEDTYGSREVQAGIQFVFCQRKNSMRVIELLAGLFPDFADAKRKELHTYFREGLVPEKTELEDEEAQSFGTLYHVEDMKIEAVDEAEKSITYVITSSAIDRYDEIVDPNGLNFENFRRSKRTVFWNHNYDVPIGRSLWEKHQKAQERWIAKVQYADGVTQFATDLWNLAKAGFVGMTSIGFMPKGYEWTKLADLQDLNPQNRSEYDKNLEILVWRKAEMLEYSVVGIGANPDAVEVEKILRSGIVRDQGLRGRLLEAEREQRLCSLESCRTGIETVPARLEALEARLHDLEQAGVNMQNLIQPLIKQPIPEKRPEIDIAELTRTLMESTRRAIRQAKGRLD